MFDSNCTLCPLHAGAHTVCVPGSKPTLFPQEVVDRANKLGADGHTDEAERLLQHADLMLVGQNPGELEDNYGAPFIGPSGQLLDDLLARAGWPRAATYVTNGAKCLTPNDRAPSARELKACAIYLKREIEAVRPKVVVALGAVALKALTNLGGLTKLLGSTQELRSELDYEDPHPKIKVIPTFHPAAAQHAKTKRAAVEAQIVNDLRTAVRSLDESFTKVDLEWSWIDTDEQAQELVRALSQPSERLEGHVISYDIETNGMPTWHPDFRIWELSISERDDHAVVFRGPPIRAGLAWLDAARKAGATLVGHNASRYDREGVFMRVGLNLICDDTQLLAQAINENGPKSLEQLCTSRLGVPPWKDEVTWTWADGPQSSEEWDRAGEYGARDAVYDRKLYYDLLKEGVSDGPAMRYHKEIVLPTSRALARLERNGIYLSSENLKTAIGEFSMQQLTARAQAVQIVGSVKFNPGSPTQVNKIVFKGWGLPAATYTDNGEESTGEYSLKWARLYANEQQKAFIDSIISYREASTMLSRYLSALARKLTRVSDGRLHPSYSLTNSPSRSVSFDDDEDDGRPTYGFNAQNVPRDPRVRRIVSAPPGYTLISADLSMNELRTGAFIAPEPAMLDALHRGEDLHRLLAARMTNQAPESVTKEQRDDAKPVQFGSMFEATGYTLGRQLLKDYNIYLPEEELDARIESWHAQWPGFRANYYPRIRNELFTTGMVRSPDGSVRHFPTAPSTTDERERDALERAAVNYPIQKFASTLAFIGLVSLVGYCGQDTWRRVVQFGHDSYLLEVLEDRAEQVAAEIKPMLETGIPEILYTTLGVNFDVPVRLDCKIQKEWM